MIPGDSVADSKGFFQGTFCQEKSNYMFERSSAHSRATEGETSPPATSTETGAAHILGTGKDDNEARD